MNIFYLNSNPRIAAQMLCDKHVIKMIVESAQMLSTAHRVLDGDVMIKKNKNNKIIKIYKHPNLILESKLYKATHINHPCNI